MKIFNGEVPSNPCTKCLRENDGVCFDCDCKRGMHYDGQLSILNKCVEVDIDKLAVEWHKYNANRGQAEFKPLSQFIQEQIEKEGKDEATFGD